MKKEIEVEQYYRMRSPRTNCKFDNLNDSALIVNFIIGSFITITYEVDNFARHFHKMSNKSHAK